MTTVVTRSLLPTCHLCESIAGIAGKTKEHPRTQRLYCRQCFVAHSAEIIDPVDLYGKAITQ